MTISWKLGRIAGIDLFLHPTLLFILIPAALSGGFSFVFLSAMFACVVLHEFGHALMARRFGIETRDITLYPIGGVARLERMPRAPGAELLIALAGPAVNFAIVAGLLGLWWIGVWDLDIESGSVVGALLGSLMVANMILGLFNLLPAFPMDGGRVLRAILSGWLGRVRATLIAAAMGRMLSLAFAVWALVFSSLPWSTAILYGALAAFIYFAAGAEEAGVLVEEQRRAYGSTNDQGIWTAPPGYHWVSRGGGVWQLAPIIVGQGRSGGNHSPWIG